MRRRPFPHRPEPGRSNYITAEGAQRLKDEMRFLWEEERPKVTQAVSDAAALGDRSENAEYIYGKKRLREIDRRLHWLRKRLEAVTIVTPQAVNTGTVYFGAWVRLEDGDGRRYDYRVVGPDEIDLDRGMISMDSPLGKALMRRSVGEEVVVPRPIGDRVYRLIDARYEPFPDPIPIPPLDGEPLIEEPMLDDGSDDDGDEDEEDEEDEEEPFEMGA